jgi:hypothetical protein
MTIEQMAIELLGLSLKDRAILAEKLIASLEEETAADVNALWAAEAMNRLRQIENDEVPLRPAAEVLEEAKNALTVIALAEQNTI